MTARHRSVLGIVGCVVLAMCAAPAVQSQQDGAGAKAAHQPSPKAKAAFDKAAAELKANDTTAALASLKAAIEADPGYLDAHAQFVNVTDDRIIIRDDSNFVRTEALATQTLLTQYAVWLKRFPKSAGVEFGIGSALSSAEDPRARPYLLKAVALDPGMAKAYELLSLDASRWGDDAGSAEYVRKAAAADPTNGEYAASYAEKFLTSDPARFRTLSLDVAHRFAGTDAGAEALSWLAYNTEGDSARAAAYEELVREFPLATSKTARPYVWRLFDTYARLAPDKAEALAEELLQLSTDAGNQADWAPKVVLARNLVLTRALMAEHKYAAAAAVLGATRLEKYSGDAEMFALLKATAADSSGNAKQAYDSLLVWYAKTPTDSTQAALARYATKLGKSAAQVDSQVWVLRDKSAAAAPPFRLASYAASGDSIALADYKGKVVLLTFWFPGCGPCRGEFPHFQTVASAFQGRGFAYVGINVEREQDAYVRSFMKGTRYTFTPLRTAGISTTGAYHVRGEPTNFLIDGQGRIIFKDFMIHDPEAERMLTLMIQSMLDHSAPEAVRGR